MNNIHINRFLYLLLCVMLLAAQPQRLPARQMLSIDVLGNELKTGTLTEAEYLKSVDEWIEQVFSSGQLFEKDSLMALLETYRGLAWKKDADKTHRINYYIHLDNNANYSRREGESIYFLEKAEQQILEIHGEKPLMVAGRKCNTYADKKNYKNVIAAYEAERDYIRSFPELIKNKNLNFNIAASFINVLHPTALAYAMLGDTAQTEETIRLAHEIHAALVQRTKPGNQAAFITNFYMQSIEHSKYFNLLHDEAGSMQVLQRMQEAIEADTAISPAIIEQLRAVWLNRAVAHHLAFQNNDQAAHYLALFKESQAVISGPADIYRHESQLLANRGQYEQAYQHAATALSKVDSIQSVLVDDIDGLLYAHTAAEFTHAALMESEQTKRKQLVWIFAIIILAASVIGWIYWMMRRQQLAAKLQINKLNDMAKFQITAMEEIRAEAVREEQKRLGRDLHDSLSATLAGLKYQIELLIMDNPTGNITQQLTTVRNHLGQAYTVSREKSHEWFEMPDNLEEAEFTERVRALLDSALPDSHFQKEVLIDMHALKNVSMELRIELLRIVHEAITNIIKHARAKWISVLLYQEENMLKLTIDDDGRGIRPSQRRGLGIQSMRERLKRFGGALTVRPREKGTEVIASIPL